MSNAQSTLRIREKAHLDREIDACLIDRQARDLSPRTVKYYEGKLGLLREYLITRGIVAVESINAPTVRRFMLELSKTHNPGGVHAVYGAVRGQVHSDPLLGKGESGVVTCRGDPLARFLNRCARQANDVDDPDLAGVHVYLGVNQDAVQTHQRATRDLGQHVVISPRMAAGPV